MKLPFVSVIIVNYNGAGYLPTCLNALCQQTYPADCFEVIVSDNASGDGSLDLLQRAYPWVRVLENDKNLGFAAGNNVAIAAARGEYLILLNNDTAPDPNWLENIVRVAQEHPQAGLVSGHLRLYYDQLVLELEAETITPSNDGRELGVQVFEVDSGAPRGVIQYLEGFYGREPHPSGRIFRWTKGRFRLGIPVPPGKGDWQATLHLAASSPYRRVVRQKVLVQGELIAELSISGASPAAYAVKLPAWTRLSATPLVQNAGSIIFRDGTGRDRGTFVRDSEVFYEIDKGQYVEVEEVFSGCGANLLLRRDMLDEVGAFDDDFFMYYEDTDLSWRARLLGWKVIFAPNAIVRHIHCGSSEEWSPFFVYHTERNHLAMLFKNAAASKVANIWGRYVARIIRQSLLTGWLLLRRKEWRPVARHIMIELKVVKTLIAWLPALIRKRANIQKQRVVPAAEIDAWFER